MFKYILVSEAEKGVLLDEAKANSLKYKCFL